MTNKLLPSLWLVIFIAGLPQFSETVYTPSLPEIASALRTSESMAEYTLTIYLFGFAIGTLFWGKLSDKIGRKPCVLAGLFVFVIGSIGCYFSDTIAILMISRFIQAFGGSIGSVIGQAICRDAFHGPALGKSYSIVSSALAFFQVIGPVIGGVIAEHFGWSSIFLFLTVNALILSFFVARYLPETHYLELRKHIPISKVVLSMIQDRKVIGFGIIVGGCNGISFSYLAEGPFYLIELLGLSPSQYGFSFISLAMGAMLGGLASRKLHDYRESKVIMGYGLIILLSGCAMLSSIMVIHTYIPIHRSWLICCVIVSQTINMFGMSVITSNALALALVDYKWCIGTASSIFGFGYYFIISLCTLFMGFLHNGTLLPMPLYFLTIALLMQITQKIMISRRK
jgi:DHA1 family bicyclomycin/chloramphenicol resistance-like MFS transporter